MRNGTVIGLNLGKNFVPFNLSSYWGADVDRADNAIRRAQSQLSTELFEATVNSDLMTRFSRRVMLKLRAEAENIKSIRKHRALTRAEERELDGLLTQHRKYYERFEYYLSKIDRSTEEDIYSHFWYYDEQTGEAVDDNTGRRYKVY